MQASLAVLSGLYGVVAWFHEPHVGWMGAVLIVANWPLYRTGAMLPLKHRVMGVPEEAADAASTAMLQQWGRRHIVRSALGVAAAIAFFWANWQAR